MHRQREVFAQPKSGTVDQCGRDAIAPHGIVGMPVGERIPVGALGDMPNESLLLVGGDGVFVLFMAPHCRRFPPMPSPPTWTRRVERLPQPTPPRSGLVQPSGPSNSLKRHASCSSASLQAGAAPLPVVDGGTFAKYNFPKTTPIYRRYEKS